MLLFASLYFLWLNLPIGSEQFGSYEANIPSNLPNNSVQFYSNMRYADKKISYSLASTCSEKRKTDFKNAIALLEQKTILSFYKADNAEITVTCSNIAPEAEEKDHFIAGEGGPSQIINASRFAIVLSGKIALYRPETCDQPQIATHELLHALGFDHNGNSQSIMYPVTNCEQQIDPEIIHEINILYSIPSLSDLLIEKASANKSGAYLDFDATIANYGLKETRNFSLEVISDGKIEKTFEIEGLEIGAKRRLTVSNLRISRNTKKIILQVATQEAEISKDNNQAELSLVQSS